MDKKVRDIHSQVPESKRQLGMSAIPTQSKSAAAVLTFRSRAQLIDDNQKKLIEDSAKWQDDYGEKVLESHKIGSLNFDFETRQFFANAVGLFGYAMSLLNFNQPYSEKLMNSDMDGLIISEQFYRTVLGFMIDMNDNLNIKLMKMYLKRLKDTHCEDEEEIGDLLDYIDEILNTTKELITFGYINVDTSFYEKLEI